MSEKPYTKLPMANIMTRFLRQAIMFLAKKYREYSSSSSVSTKRRSNNRRFTMYGFMLSSTSLVMLNDVIAFFVWMLRGRRPPGKLDDFNVLVDE